MQAFPKFETKVSRVIAWLTALTALALLAAPRAKAEDAKTSRPPVSEAAIQSSQSSTTASPSTTPPSSGTSTQSVTAPAASPATTAPAKTSTKSSKKSSKKSAPKPQAEEPAPTPMTMTKEVSLTESASTDSAGMTLRGGQERTDFKTMTIEGEDRVHVDVERPELQLDLDASKVHGLESGTAADVLNRVSPDLTTKYLALSATQPTPYLGRPWLRQFATGPVAKFQPNVKGVERWKLVVADSKGELVRTFDGKGDPPKEITWDGRTQNGKLVTPGLTYSYYMEAFDKAGNKRNFVGEGFKVSAYRADTPAGPVLVFSGMSVLASQKSSYGMASANRAVAPVILETVSWLNQSTRVQQPVTIAVSARSYEQANLIAKQVGMTMTDLALGDPSRIKAVAEVAPDAADGGVVRVSLAGADPTTGTAVDLSGPAKDSKKESKKESKKDSQKSSKKDSNKK